MAQNPGIKTIVGTTVGVVTASMYRTNLHTTPGNIALFCIASGTNTYSVQYTGDDVWDMADPNTSAVWLPHPFLTSMTVSATAGNFAFPPSAVRLVVDAMTTSTTPRVRLNIIQPGWAGNR